MGEKRVQKLVVIIKNITIEVLNFQKEHIN